MKNFGEEAKKSELKHHSWGIDPVYDKDGNSTGKASLEYGFYFNGDVVQATKALIQLLVKNLENMGYKLNEAEKAVYKPKTVFKVPVEMV